MARKKQLDNLSMDMIRCKADGYGCHYGSWKALHPNTKDNVDEPVPQGWLFCKECGNPFKPKTKRSQFYCEPECQRRAALRNFKEKHQDYYKNRMAEKRARHRSVSDKNEV